MSADMDDIRARAREHARLILVDRDDRTESLRQEIEAAAAVAAHEDIHMGRWYSGHAIEDNCPCPQAACGLVASSATVPECEHHPEGRKKTMRHMHPASRCPARAS